VSFSRSLPALLAVAVSLGTLAATTPASAQSKAECLASFDRGQELRNRSRLRAARDEFTVCARSECSPPVRKDCAERVEGVMRDMPTLVPAARLSSGGDLPDVAVFVDDERVRPDPGGSIAVDPGRHTLRFERAPYPPQTEEVVALIGQKNRVVVATFPAPAETTPAARPAGEAPAPPSSSSPSPSRSPSRSLGTWILGGVGVAALGSFTFFALSGTAKHSHFEDTCKPGCSDDEIAQVRTRFIAADVSLGVALVALAAATYLFVTMPAPSRQRLARSF
jgi:hypothetical protein